MNLAEIQCAHCSHPFKVKYIVKPKTVHCPKCKRIGALTPRSPAQESSSSGSTTTQPKDKMQTATEAVQARKKAIRNAIWREVAPTKLKFADEQAIIGIGSQAVPAIIEIFLQPKCPNTGIACNQAVLTSALRSFARKGNSRATTFLRKIAAGQVDLYDTWGEAAFRIAKEYLSQLPEEQKPVTERPAEKSLHSCATCGRSNVELLPCMGCGSHFCTDHGTKSGSMFACPACLAGARRDTIAELRRRGSTVSFLSRQ